VDVEFHAAGDATPTGVPVKAGLDISFSSKYSVFFTAAQCLPSYVADQVTLANTILDLYRQGKWQRKFALITGALQAGATTVVISASDNASIGLEASAAGIARIDLSDASLKLSLTRARSVGFKAVTENGLTPLIGLSRIQGIFDEQLKPAAAPLAPGAQAAAPGGTLATLAPMED